MDTDISHAAKAIFDDHESRLAAIEEHLGFEADEADDVVEDGDEDTEDTEDE